jgi:Protein of unknown function (DUF3485)
MNKQKWILLITAMALMSVTGGLLYHLKTHQRLGVPGIKATPIPGSVVMQIDLPERVLDFTSTNLPQGETVTNMLPKDTSFASRRYQSSNDFWVTANIVMMGKDRTSIHKPEYCLPGQGWRIDSQTNVAISIAGPHPYELPVAKWTVSISFKDNSGQMREVRGLYVFWFVADNEETPSHWQRIMWLARDLLKHGVLQRWAYVSYFTICAPGQEDATFERVQKLIAASVPEFQLPPQSATSNAVARQ